MFSWEISICNHIFITSSFVLKKQINYMKDYVKLGIKPPKMDNFSTFLHQMLFNIKHLLAENNRRNRTVHLVH